MPDNVKDNDIIYNLEGGVRRLVIRNGQVKAVAPGLRLVDATDEEKKELMEQLEIDKEEELDYGLPV